MGMVQRHPDLDTTIFERQNEADLGPPGQLPCAVSPDFEQQRNVLDTQIREWRHALRVDDDLAVPQCRPRVHVQ